MRRWIAWTVLALMVVAGVWLFLCRTGGRSPIAPKIAVAARVAVAVGGPAEVESDSIAVESQTPRTEVSAGAEPERATPPPPSDAVRVLEVRVFAADGSAWADGTVRLVPTPEPFLGLPELSLELLPEQSEAPVFDLSRSRRTGHSLASQFDMWVPRLAGVSTDASTSEGIGILGMPNDELRQFEFMLYSRTTDGEGRARFEGTGIGRMDRPFRVFALDPMGYVGGGLDEQPLAPGEERRVELHLSRTAWPLLGRCSDAAGVPREHVAIEVRAGNALLTASTDGKGEFLTPPLFAERVSILARHHEYGVAILTGVAPGPGLCEVRLRPSRTLTVHTANGGGMAGIPSVSVRLDVDGPEVDGPEIALAMMPSAECFLTDLPREPLVLVIERPVPRQVLAVPADVEEITWDLPGQGMLDLSLDALPDFEGGTHAIEVRSLDVPDAPAEIQQGWRGSARLQSLWCGRYRLQLVFLPDARPDLPIPRGEPLEVEIRAGEITTASLGG
jgi:hypothetical protein